jgi:hypothetical protein
LIPAILFSLVVPSFAAGDLSWRQMKSRRFTVLMPGNSHLTSGTQWVSTDTKGRAYNASSGYLMEPPADPSEYFKETAETAAEGTQGRLVYKKFFTLQGQPACEFKVEGAKHIVVGRLILAGQWIYILEYATDIGTFDTGPMRKFFGSFQLLKF